MIGVMRPCIIALAGLLLASCVDLQNVKNTPLPNGALYVAMGSSFAAGPGVTLSADNRDPRCSRSNDNYARQVARTLKLKLVDVSCSGATTRHILEGWNELPPQIAALSLDTALVTVTIGGNDVGYVGRLFAGSCGNVEAASEAVKASCAAMHARARATGTSPPAAAPDDASWKALEAGLAAIAAEVHNRSPQAKLIFVEYLTIVPDGAACGTVPLSPENIKIARETALRLRRLTNSVAKSSGAGVLPTASLSRNHDACSAEPWANGFVPAKVDRTFVPYHPNLNGMSAVANALIAKLR